MKGCVMSSPVLYDPQAMSYRQRILDAVPSNCPPFTPLMTLYLTDK